MLIPDKIKTFTGSRSFELDTIGKSGSQVLRFEDMVLKIQNNNEESKNELEMMTWLSKRLSVPSVLCAEINNQIQYLLMSRVPGEMSCSEHLLQTPEKLVKLLAEGLKTMWDVDITGCPCDNSIDNKLKAAAFLVQNNRCSMEDVEPDTYGPDGFESPAELLCWLEEHKPQEDIVFSHGDFCLPNIFICEGKISGFIDLGRSGTADRYQDIALCYRSLRDNLSGRYSQEGPKKNNFDPMQLFEELNIVPDWDKMKFYMLLDELF